MLELRLYTRPGCHLCEDAAGLLRRLQAETPFELREVNVDQDPALRERYGEQIPVIESQGRVIARAPIVERRLREVVRRALRDTVEGEPR